MKILTPKSLLDLLGVRYTERSNRLQMICPFHDDHSPSCGFYLDSDRFYCFACSLTLDLVGFYAKYTGVNRSRAMTELEAGFEVKVDQDKIDRKQVVDRERARAEHSLALLAGQHIWDRARMEERVARLLWEYETGKIPDVKFRMMLSTWKNECDPVPTEIASSLE